MQADNTRMQANNTHMQADNTRMHAHQTFDVIWRVIIRNLTAYPVLPGIGGVNNKTISIIIIIFNINVGQKSVLEVCMHIKTEGQPPVPVLRICQQPPQALPKTKKDRIVQARHTHHLQY